MEKVAIVYFSGTGNTKYIAEKMKEAIVKTDMEVDLINIEKDKINPNIYKHIIIGGPVYVERYPEILLKYMESNLSNYKGTCMLYSTQGSEGLTPVFKHAIKRINHLKVTYCKHLYMPNNFYNFGFKKCPKEKEIELIKSASIEAQKGVLEFFTGRTNSWDISNSRVVLAEMVYRLVYSFFRSLMMKKLSVDENKCIKCGLCEKSCPGKSIKVFPKLTINNNCTFCQRCINICPKNAFLYKGKAIDQYKPNLKGDK